MTPEQKARRQIDRMLADAGWAVQDRKELDLTTGAGVSLRELPGTQGVPDYLLFADEQAAGVVEAKKVGMTLSGVAEQSGPYLAGRSAPRGLQQTGEAAQRRRTRHLPPVHRRQPR